MPSARWPARCKSNLIRTRALTPDSCPRPMRTLHEGTAPSLGVADAPGFRAHRTPGRSAGPLAPSGDRGLPNEVGSTLQTSTQLPAPRRGTPPCHSALPVLTSLNTVHFPSRRGGGNRSPAPAPPPENAFVPGTRSPARRKRCGRRTIPRRGAHNHRPPGPAARAARERSAPPALRAGHTSRAPRSPQSAAFPAPITRSLTRPPPQPTPPRAQPLP